MDNLVGWKILSVLPSTVLSVDLVCVAEDREHGQSAVLVGMNFGVW